jgi:hypothetical protein
VGISIGGADEGGAAKPARLNLESVIDDEGR